jgi:hypothetical protein
MGVRLAEHRRLLLHPFSVFPPMPEKIEQMMNGQTVHSRIIG